MEVDDRTLFIGNIDKNVSEEILYELFLQAGPVERVSIPSSRNDSSRYGFVTYKHECSINYALELFKGTILYKKELSIKKRCPKNNINGQPPNDPNKFGNINSTSEKQEAFDFQNQLQSLQLLAQNLSHNSQSIVNFTPDVSRGNWSSRNKPYNLDMKHHFSRFQNIKDRHRNRDYGKKMYHSRKTRERYRD